MNELKQHKLFLLGSNEAVDALAKKDCATILAVSDSHGRPEILKTILKRFSSQADALAFLGDGCADLVHILNNLDSNKDLQTSLPPVIAMVHGNGDESVFDVDFYPSEDLNVRTLKAPAAITFFAAGKNVLVTHGHMFGVYYGTAGLENHAKKSESKIILYGHSHVADISENNGITFINPGSCSLPRQGLPPSIAEIKIHFTGEIECTFYEIKASLSEGIKFVPFSPLMRRW